MRYRRGFRLLYKERGSVHDWEFWTASKHPVGAAIRWLSETHPLATFLTLR